MTTNDQLRQLMAEHVLTAEAVAGMLGKSADTVRAWLKSPGAKSHRRMQPNDLRILRLELSTRE